MGLDEIRKLKEQALLPKQPKPRKPIAKKSKKKLQQETERNGIKKTCGSELDRWFQDRRKEMTGRCWHCQGVSCKNSHEYFKFSIAHLLPKRLFKSVTTHPLNWIELCFWEQSCHTNFDNNTLDITELSCYDLVIERFMAIYPDIAPKERKYIPDILLQYVKNETDTK
jgi:hypothetical protein